MFFWHIALLILLIVLLMLLIFVVLQRNWIRLIFPGFPNRERLIENGKIGLLFLVVIIITLLIWIQIAALTALPLYDAFFNGGFWGSVITLGVSIASYLRGRKDRVSTDVPKVDKNVTRRRYAWFLLVLLLIGSTIPYLVVFGNYNAVREGSQMSLDGSLEFSTSMLDYPLVSQQQFWVYAQYLSFPSNVSWAFDNISIQIDVRDDSGVLVSSTELYLNAIRSSVWLFVRSPASQTGGTILQVPGPGLYFFDLTTEFDQSVQITVVQMWQPLMDILFIIAALGWTGFIAGAVWLSRRQTPKTLVSFQVSGDEGR